MIGLLGREIAAPKELALEIAHALRDLGHRTLSSLDRR
jgi:hypothetical protein